MSSFAIDFDAQQATCPQGNTSSSWNPVAQPGADTIVITFAKGTCGHCPARAQYTASASGRHPGHQELPGQTRAARRCRRHHSPRRAQSSLGAGFRQALTVTNFHRGPADGRFAPKHSTARRRIRRNALICRRCSPVAAARSDRPDGWGRWQGLGLAPIAAGATCQAPHSETKSPPPACGVAAANRGRSRGGAIEHARESRSSELRDLTWANVRQSPLFLSERVPGAPQDRAAQRCLLTSVPRRATTIKTVRSRRPSAARTAVNPCCLASAKRPGSGLAILKCDLWHSVGSCRDDIGARSRLG
jgi:hypothetical protein